MMLVDTGPLVALFDPADRAHQACRKTLRALKTPLSTTVPVLTEVFHLLDPASRGSDALREMVRRGGISVWFLGEGTLERALELMEKYADRPMDLADASLVTAAEALRTTRVLTLDRADFATYRARIGRTHRTFLVVDPTKRA
jgi:predicted nucleic acid-binding protein